MALVNRQNSIAFLFPSKLSSSRRTHSPTSSTSSGSSRSSSPSKRHAHQPLPQLALQPFSANLKHEPPACQNFACQLSLYIKPSHTYTTQIKAHSQGNKTPSPNPNTSRKATSSAYWSAEAAFTSTTVTTHFTASTAILIAKSAGDFCDRFARSS
ncbi:uncharacterized protein C8R40DRAFT_1177365 [Lentinula edodes]|uniref:uncharacterized protein n=1 Tax=Lentinula edodes TaxID=5353 RepID=UPI001E8CA55C|nr:uncharacterized protein C8R40DRAFT_1177365 [Lentinula edodes]KAH7868773.1 hypothetical protein C8R40DRAFT_1177365 [Lentinula edodes]